MASSHGFTDRDGSDLGGVLLRGDRTYELARGVTIPVDEQLAWCRRCEKFVAAEDLSRPRPIAPGTPYETWRQIRIWQKTRKSPPRCLECGTVEIVVVPDGEEFLHPALQIPVRSEVTALVSLFVEWPPLIYDSEGCLLDELERMCHAYESAAARRDSPSEAT